MYIKNFITSLSLLLLINCNKQMNTTTNQNLYPYEVTTTATEYPTEVHIGYLLNEKGELICGVPKTGIDRDHWQYDGSGGGQGGAEMPAYLSLTYVSYAEKKFYNVEAKLPTEKFLEVFRKGYTRSDTVEEKVSETYKKLTIGMAPGGVVIVWLSGVRHRKEIVRLQAKETFVDKNEFRPVPFEDESQEEFFNLKYNITLSDSIKQDIKQNGIPYGLWDKYREKYKYRFVFRPYDERDKLTYLYSRNYDGEAYEILEPELDRKQYIEQGIPYNYDFIFKSYSTEIIFNDREMLSVFGKLKEKHPGKPMDIIITPTFMYNDMKISIKAEQTEIPLTKYKVVGVWGGN